MDGIAGYFVSVWLKFFILLTPFFVLSMFLALTAGQSERERRRLALQVAGAVVAGALLLYFFGNGLFRVLGITIDAFRVGAGALLFLSAVSLARGDHPEAKRLPAGDIAVVPLAIPITIGPATTGALLVMGAERRELVEQVVGCLALAAAAATVGVMLLLAPAIHRLLGDRGLSILGKLTGLGLAAMAAQMILAGAFNAFLLATS